MCIIGIPIDSVTSPSAESEHQFWNNPCITNFFLKDFSNANILLNVRGFLKKFSSGPYITPCFNTGDAKILHHKPATHYSSLFPNNDKTTFLRKKIEFRKM